MGSGVRRHLTDNLPWLVRTCGSVDVVSRIVRVCVMIIDGPWRSSFDHQKLAQRASDPWYRLRYRIRGGTYIYLYIVQV